MVYYAISRLSDSRFLATYPNKKEALKTLRIWVYRDQKGYTLWRCLKDEKRMVGDVVPIYIPMTLTHRSGEVEHRRLMKIIYVEPPHGKKRIMGDGTLKAVPKGWKI